MDTQTRIFADQLDLLYRQAWGGILATAINSIILVMVLWPITDHRVLLSWLALILGITLGRTLLVHQYQRQRAARIDGETDTPCMIWRRRYILGASLSGLCWGLAGSALFPEHHATQQMVLAVILAGMAAGAVPIMSSVSGVYPFFLLPTLIPFGLWTGLHPTLELRVVGLMTVLFTLVLLQASRLIQKTLHETLRLKYENATLVETLSQTKRNVEGLNRNLELEIAEHKAVRRRLHAIFDNASEGIVILDGQGHIDSLNRAACGIFRCTSEEVAGRDGCQQLFANDAEDAPPDNSDLLRCRERFLSEPDAELARFVEVTGQRLGGQTFPMEITTSRVEIDQQHINIWLVRDITERKELERMKNEFVSTVSHELRTPLTAIRGALSLVTQGIPGQLSDQYKQLVDIAANNSERLLRLINDILDIEKIESGNLSFRMRPVLATELARQALTMNKSYADLYQVAFKLEAAAEEARLNLDSDRMLQVLTNLLSNAAKFSPTAATVTLSLQTTQDTLRFTVTDTGPGIPEDYQPHVFEKFSQADSSDARQRGGTGLGLSISKALVEQMGGQIGFETQVGRGTQFHVTFPIWHGKAF